MDHSIDLFGLTKISPGVDLQPCFSFEKFKFYFENKDVCKSNGGLFIPFEHRVEGQKIISERILEVFLYDVLKTLETITISIVDLGHNLFPFEKTRRSIKF